MQPVNDDMDNLFRRAADKYPLNTHGADFDKVKQQVDAETSVPEKKEHKRRYLWLLLLLIVPLAFLLNYYKTDTASHNNQSNKTYQGINQENLDDVPVTTRVYDSSSVNNEEKLVNKSNTKEATNNEENIAILKQTGDEKQKVQINNTTDNSAERYLRKKQNVKYRNKVSNNQNKPKVDLVSKRNKNPQLIGNSFFRSSSNRKVNNNYTDLPGKTANEIASRKLENADVIKQTQSDTNSLTVDSTVQAITSNGIKDSSVVAKKDDIPDSTANRITRSTKSKNKGTAYIGVVTGPDYTVVKSTKAGSPGYNVGFVAGYRTGKHLAFETGVIWNYKKYYSDGKYVSTNKLALPNHTQVLYLDGSCGIIEIPINARYHFNAIGKHGFYTGAGVSSYLLKEEEYYYKYKRYNVEYYGEKEYSNSSKNWLSVLQLHVGYELSLKKAGSLRFEPYAKLPLQGIGIGKLPLAGAGINIGFTLPLH
jgi:hypothetical protein